MTKSIVRRELVNLTIRLHESSLVHRILSSRGVTDPEDVTFALNTLPKPDKLPGVSAAVSRLCKALKENQHVLVVGDYDCDGATSTTLAVLVLRAFGFQKVSFLVPNRFEYGYGLSPAIVDAAAEQKPDLIVTVDNGVASVEGVERAREHGIDVVVTDHHLPPKDLPDAVAVVNPSLRGSAFESKNLAGVGVIFYVLVALRAELAKHNCAGSDARLADYLDLVAIGTVADVVPLDAVNRNLVENGLRRIRAGRTRSGVSALLARAGREQHRTYSEDIGFAIGPRLNAAGRLSDISKGIDCLLTEDDVEAHKLAAELETLNQQRRGIEKKMRQEADAILGSAQAEAQADRADSGFSVVLFDAGWHHGVIGILAGRLKDALHKPTVVFASDGPDSIRGSARSIEGVHIRDVFEIISTERPGLIEKFGGHAMAAGLSLKRSALDAFRAAFDKTIKRVTDSTLPSKQWVSDGSLNDNERTLANAQLLQNISPWGQGFPAPLFDDEFLVEEARVVGKVHLKLVLRSVNADPAIAQGNQFAAIAFNQPDTVSPGESIRLAYSLSENRFRGASSLQLLIKHIQLIES